MTKTNIGKPDATEYNPYYGKYISLVADGDTEMPCWGWAGCGCGPPLMVPAEFVLCSADAASRLMRWPLQRPQ